MGLKFHGSVGSFADLPSSGQESGDSYVVADEGDKLYVWDSDAGEWVSGGSIQGPAGPAGEPGEAGPRGTRWFTGTGAPPAEIPGALEGDLYLDLDTGDVYALQVPTGIPVGDLPALGGELQGGFYGGLYSMNADGVATHALIVAPKATGDSSSLTWKNANTAGSGYTSTFDGFANSEAAAAAGSTTYPAASWARALTIGGYSDWYIPSRYELNALYWTLKPAFAGDAPNAAFDGFGNNAYAVPQRGDFGEGENPNGEEVNGFRFSEAQAFETQPYGTSLQGASAGQIVTVSFDSGGAWDYDKTNSTARWRAIRKVPVTV